MVDWDGAGYGHISDLQRTMASNSIAAVTVNGDERVLDVGCGDGYVTRLIADRLPNGSVLGIDPSPRMIAAAQPSDNAQFEIGDVTTMSFDSEFDLAVSFNALHWVHDQATAYANLAAALRPGGRLIVQFVCAGGHRSVEQVAMDVTRDPRWSGAFAGFTPPFVHIDPASLTSLADEAGLSITAQTVADQEWDFGSREGFTAWCTVGFTDWTSHLDAADVDAFVEAVVNRYEQIVGKPGVFRFMQLRAELKRVSATGYIASAQ